MSAALELQLAQQVAERKWDAAFDLLISSSTGLFYKAALRIVLQDDDAKDVLQEAFVKMWENLPHFRAESKVTTWAYRIVVNEALGHLRKKKKHSLVGRLSDFEEIHEGVPISSSFTGDEILETLYKAIAQLPEKQKLVFQLRYFDELPYSEITTILGTSEGGLKANYFHAVQKIQKFVETVKPNSGILIQ